MTRRPRYHTPSVKRTSTTAPLPAKAGCIAPTAALHQSQNSSEKDPKSSARTPEGGSLHGPLSSRARAQGFHCNRGGFALSPRHTKLWYFALHAQGLCSFCRDAPLVRLAASCVLRHPGSWCRQGINLQGCFRCAKGCTAIRRLLTPDGAGTVRAARRNPNEDLPLVEQRLCPGHRADAGVAPRHGSWRTAPTKLRVLPARRQARGRAGRAGAAAPPVGAPRPRAPAPRRLHLCRGPRSPKAGGAQRPRQAARTLFLPAAARARAEAAARAAARVGRGAHGSDVCDAEPVCRTSGARGAAGAAGAPRAR